MQIRYWLFFILLFCLLNVFQVYAAKPLRFDRISIEAGLSHSEVNSIIQDSTGFIWIATRHGLNRFDGSRFFTFFHKPNEITSIPSNDISQLLKDDGDNFWVVTKRGVSYFDAIKSEMQQFPFSDVDGMQYTYHVNNLLKNREGQILAATSNGLFLFDDSIRGFLKLRVPNPDFDFLNYSDIHTLINDNLNRLWIGTLKNGLFIFDQKQGKVNQLAYMDKGLNTLVNNKIFSIFQDNFGIIWVGTETGLYAFKDQGLQPVRYLPGDDPLSLPHRSVNQIYEDSQNRLWILTNGGVSVFNRDSENFTNFLHKDFDPGSMSSNAFRTMYEDFQGNLWFGGVEDGLNIVKAHDIEFENYARIPNNPLSLNYPHVLSMVEDKDGNLWVGTNGGGINIYNKARNKVSYVLPPENDPSAVQADAIMSLFCDEHGSVWVGTYLGGLAVYKANKSTIETYKHNPLDSNSLSSDIVYKIYSSLDGKMLIATNRGVDLFDPKKQKFTVFASFSVPALYNISSDYITSMITDSEGNLWIGSHYGLNKIDSETQQVEIFHHNGQEGEISDNSVFCLFEDSQERLWVGTDNGLNLYNRDSGFFSVFTMQDGLPNSTITGIQEDHLGNIWVSTLNGLSKFDISANNFYNFGLDDGLATVEFSYNAAYKGANGKLYFGGRKGMIAFNPSFIRLPDYRSPVVFTNMYINNILAEPGATGSPLEKAINYTSKLVLNYDQSFISFDFTTLNFINPRKDNFEYKLEGFDPEWVTTGNNRTANYTRLPAGKYTFSVRAVQNAQIVAISKPIEIVVKPPFWLSSWAYLFYFALSGLMIYAIWRFFYERAMYSRRIFVEKLESEKLIELNKAKLRFFINVAHEFKTPLTLILSPLELLANRGIKSQPAASVTKTIQTAYRNALRLSRLISQIMELRRIDTGNSKLRVQEVDIVGFLKDICTNFEDYAHNHDIEFQFASQYDEYKLWMDADKIEKAFFNLLSNAFRFTQAKGEVTVLVRYSKQPESLCQKAYPSVHGFLLIDVKDTGPGIDKSQQIKIFERFYQNNNDVLYNPASTGIGLSIVKEFVELHKGCILLDSEPGKGSTFTLVLPVGNEHFSTDEISDSDAENLRKYISSDESDEKRTGAKPFYHETARGYPHKILVVEDNHELRNFILDNLESKYEVHEADNGREGLRLAETIHPDLIISDIMMPGFSGIELVKRIKSDVNTSHIPIILMTVLSDLSQQVEGIESGADAYITKPFHFSLLEANITSLIDNRRAVINKFLADPKPEVNTIPISKLDQAVLKKAMEVMEKNMENENFSAEDFSQEMNMSRSSLHVKLKALTNLSATEFIRAVRLKKAVELLSQQEYSVSQVASMVGFKSISYFNRCFKNTYGQSPSNYL